MKAAPEKLRAWWAHKQGLDGTLEGQSATQVLERAGWARSVGGASPYLTLDARAGLARETVDAAAAALEICELPSARNCTYVLPAADFALGLKSGESFAGGEMNVARKLGVTDKEIEKLRAAVLRALSASSEPLDPDALRDVVGGAVRSLGAEGTKKGIASTMPVALGLLQAAGEIRRVPVNGRLDQQRYRYTAWRPSPLESCTLDAAQAQVELARRYFGWIGPARSSEFQWFSGLGAKAAKAAMAEIELEPIEPGSDLMLPAAERKTFDAFRVPAKACYALVSAIDSLLLLRRDVGSLLDDADRERPVTASKGTASAVGSLADLPSHAIVDRGRVVGLWEFDPDSSSIAWTSFTKPDRAMKDAVARTEAFVRDQLGDARGFSLDSPKSRQPRIQALRQR